MSPYGYQSLARNIAIASLEQSSDLRSLHKIDRDNAKSIKNIAGALSEIAATGCPMDIDASRSGCGGGRASGPLNRIAQRLYFVLNLCSEGREQSDDKGRNQPASYRIFHNGKAIFVVDELHYRSLDCLHDHFAHLTRMLFFLRQYFLRCLMQH
ncbi:hypothetical protein BSF44_10870 [Pseudomonas sp. ACN8]|nr:hypothetical protein BSF44_10870 [Pseudomonas sp. ACN8]